MHTGAVRENKKNGEETTQLAEHKNLSRSRLRDNTAKTRSHHQQQETVNNSVKLKQLKSHQSSLNSSSSKSHNVQLQKQANKAQVIIQKKENTTGLPDNLKSGIEGLSGMSLDSVKVHRNSSEPAKLQAHAFAQGSDIHLAANQEKHLPHEAWHVVQQMQGRVKPTAQAKGKVNINNDKGLEQEADIMGERALSQNAIQHANSEVSTQLKADSSNRNAVVQRVLDKGKKRQTDESMNSLNERTIILLSKIASITIQEKAKEQQGQAKGEALADKSDEVLYALTHPTDAIKQKAVEECKKAAKNAWKEMPVEDKLYLCANATGALSESLATVVVSISKNGDLGEPKKKSILTSIKGKVKGVRASSVDFGFNQIVSEVDGQDLVNLYQLMREKSKAQKVWEDANEKVRAGIKSVLASAGAKIGGAIGSSQDSLMQLKLASEILPEKNEIHALFESLKNQAKENEDDSYIEEFQQLGVILESIRGPLGFIAGDMNMEGLAHCKEQAARGINNLKLAQSRRKSSLVKVFTNMFGAQATFTDN